MPLLQDAGHVGPGQGADAAGEVAVQQGDDQVRAALVEPLGGRERLAHHAVVEDGQDVGMVQLSPDHRLLLTRSEVESDRGATLSTRLGDEVVLFGADEASHWRVESV